jgi:tetratricopeptide (TPR) repeat protein
MTNPETTVAELLQRADQYQHTQCLDQAEQLYRQILEQQPDHVEALCRLASLVQHNGNLDEAEQCLTIALGLQPHSVEVWFSLGNVYQAQGQLLAAENAYRHASCLRSDCAPIYNNLGYVLQQQGQLDEAIACYHTCLELQPACPEAEASLGSILQAQGQLSPQQQAYYAALNQQLGHEYQQIGDLDTAIAYYRQAIAVQPHCCEAYSSLGMALQTQGAWDEAIRCYQTWLEFDPEDGEVYQNLGKIYQTQNQLTQAIAAYRQGLKLLNPHYAAAVEANATATPPTQPPVTPPLPEATVTVGAYEFPAIPPVSEPDQPRPFWSVVMPVYNRTDYLLEALASVLRQWPGAAEMEILVVDNASNPPLFELVNAIGSGIIRYYRHPQNLGAVRNANAGIALSRGQWVHILHDDDCVLPDFYTHLKSSLERCPASVGAACTNFQYFNEIGAVIEAGEINSCLANQPGILTDFLRNLGVTCPLQIPAVVMRRSALEQLLTRHRKIVHYNRRG